MFDYSFLRINIPQSALGSGVRLCWLNMHPSIIIELRGVCFLAEHLTSIAWGLCLYRARLSIHLCFYAPISHSRQYLHLSHRAFHNLACPIILLLYGSIGCPL